MSIRWGYANGREAKAGVAQWGSLYNGRRPEMAFANRTPMVVWRDGDRGTLDGSAVEMTPPLDNANALPNAHSRNNSREG